MFALLVIMTGRICAKICTNYQFLIDSAQGIINWLDSADEEVINSDPNFFAKAFGNFVIGTDASKCALSDVLSNKISIKGLTPSQQSNVKKAMKIFAGVLTPDE